MNDDRIAEILAGDEAWIVGGAVRDFLLGRRVLDIDVACREPRAAANRFARRFGGAPFPLSERHGAWRVVAEGAEETVDFTPLPGGIDADLGTRDFTFNAIAVPVGGGDPHDPYRRRHSWRSALRFNQDHISGACPCFGLDWRVASLRRPATRLACKAGDMLRDSGRRRVSVSAGSAFRLVDLQGNRR